MCKAAVVPPYSSHLDSQTEMDLGWLASCCRWHLPQETEEF